MPYLSSFLLALFVAMASIPVLIRGARLLGAVDLPNPRKVHGVPMPKTGGIGMALGALVPVMIWAPPSAMLRALLFGAGIVVLFGFVDDVKELGYQAKFAGQTLAALVVILYGGVEIHSLGMLLPEGTVLPHFVSVPLTLFVILGVTNAINLSDGLDGLAGGLTALSFGCIAVLAYQVEMPTVALVAAAVAGAIFGFLRFNTHPATVFMGDSGSQFLGFTAITLALHLTQANEPLSPLLPLVVLGLPVLDTLFVMTERIANGRSPFVADKNHLHHKLIGLGLYHADAVRVIYVIQAGLILAAYFLRFHSDWLLLLSYGGFAAAVVGGLLLADGLGWRIERYAPAIARTKTRVQVLREKGLAVRVVFRLVLVGLPAVLLFSVAAPEDIPGAGAVAAAGLAGAIAWTAVSRSRWAPWATKIAVFAMLPFLVYLSEVACSGWAEGPWMRAYNVSVAALALLSLLVVKLTRRKQFRSTPLDLLILLVAVGLPLLGRDPHHMGVITAKILALFFVCEVLFTELRGEHKWMQTTALATLALVALRGVF